MNLWTIIMAGGLGSRFWPIAGVASPKQFTDVMGTGSTMLQDTFRRFEHLCQRDHIVIVTGEKYAHRVHEEIPQLEPHQVLSEPIRRNTAPCIAYAASVIAHLDPEATLLITPADHAIFHEELFQADLQMAMRSLEAAPDRIVTIGALPTRPDTSYGYIQIGQHPDHHDDHARMHPVVTFTEKPPVEMARQMIASGEFLWNTGLLLVRCDTLMQAYRKHLPALAESFFDTPVTLDTPRTTMEQIYSTTEAISVDRGLLETSRNVYVLEASFGWSDVETWDSLYEVSPHDAHGNALLGGAVLTYNTTDTLVSLPEGTTAVIEGLHDYIVAARGATLMICRREQEEMVFKFASDVEMTGYGTMTTP